MIKLIKQLEKKREECKGFHVGIGKIERELYEAMIEIAKEAARLPVQIMTISFPTRPKDQEYDAMKQLNLPGFSKFLIIDPEQKKSVDIKVLNPKDISKEELQEMVRKSEEFFENILKENKK
jgi:hypothetical protein